MREMLDTSDIREKMLVLWQKVDTGKITHQEARVHIGIARTVLDTLKVEIAAAHLQESNVPSVALSSKRPKVIQGRRAA
jgi:hypothetical protein